MATAAITDENGNALSITEADIVAGGKKIKITLTDDQWIAGGGCEATGDWSAGNLEGFESGAGAFCTNGWSALGTQTRVNTYDSANYKSGTHSLSYDRSATMADGEGVKVDIGTPDGSHHVMFWHYLDGVLGSGGRYTKLAAAGTSSTEWGGGYEAWAITYFDWDTNNKSFTFRLGDNNNATNNWTLTDAEADGHWYRFEVDYNANGSCSLKIYDVDGNLKDTKTGTDVINRSPQYFAFGNLDSNYVTANKMYWDRIKYSGTAGSDIGP